MGVATFGALAGGGGAWQVVDGLRIATAVSVALPPAAWPAPSADRVCGLEHVATPDSASAHAHVTVTGAP